MKGSKCMKTERCFMLVVSLLLGAVASQAATWYVSKSGFETNAGNTSTAPYASVTNALAHAGAGDLIEVSAGVYTQTAAFAAGKASITIRGGYDPSSWTWSPSANTTTVRGVAGASVVTFAAGANSNTLSCLTLYGAVNPNAGVLISSPLTNLTIDGCSIVSNYNGVYCNFSPGSVIVTLKNTLVARSSNCGVLLYADSGSCTMYNCTVVSNAVHGFLCNNNSSRNDWGDPVAVAKNCVFSDNGQWGLYKGGSTTGSTLANNLFYNNTIGSVGGQNVTDLGGNKTGRSPKFTNPGTLDYSVATNSPAAAAGTDLSAVGVTNDILGVSRPQGTWDMGAYEGSGAGETALSNVVYVSTNGNNATGDGSSNAPWATVSFGLGNVAPSGTVLVAGGTYTDRVHFGPGNEFMTIKGGYDPTTWTWSPAANHTVINGNTYAPIQLDACADTTTVCCVTLTNGTAYPYNAGILYNARIYGTIIDGCTIISNTYGVAGAYVCTMTIKNSLIVRNAADGFNFNGGNGGVCYIYNCTVATNGGAGYYSNSGNANWGAINLIAKNTLFTDNKTYGIYVYGAGANTMANCLVCNNVSGPTGGNISDLGGNKSGRDPKYVGVVSNDFRVATNSPAAAAGTNLVSVGVTNDIVGVARPGPSGFDMGAYQGSGGGEPPLPSLGYVSASGADSTGDGTTNNPWITVNHALAYVAQGATIRVAAGTYTGSVQFAADRKLMTVRGGYDPSTWTWNPSANRTIIYGNSNPPVAFSAASDSNTLSCLTLTGGGANAGVLISGNLNALTIDGCTIVSNTYGIAAVDITMTATVRNTLVARNTSYGFNFNAGSSQGGSCTLYNCTVANNGGSGYYDNGGSWAWGSITPFVKNTLFTDNGGYGLEHGGVSAGAIQNCLFYNNTLGPTATKWYNTCLPDLGGNKSGRDPKYVNAASLNYSVAANSPASAAGTNLVSLGVTNDIVNVSRPGSAGWDMGAYQGSGSGESALTNLVYVRPTGSNVSGDGSSGNPWATVNYALGYVAPSGTVRVAGGTYSENVQFGPDKKGITIQGGYDPTTWVWAPAANQSVISAFGSGRAPILLTSAAESNTLSYLTLRGGTNTAGVFVNGYVAKLLIDGCQIVSNSVGINGGPFLTTPTVRNTLLARNSSHGIYFNETHSGSSPGQSALYNCTVVSNSGNGFMGDFASGDPDNVPVAKNCLFTDNGLYGIYKGGNSSGGSMQNCLFYNNVSGATNVAVGSTFTNLGANLMASLPLYVNAAAGNYQLQRLSPAVDTGTNLTALGVTMDLLGVHRPLGAGFDRGAYERSGFPAASVIILE